MRVALAGAGHWHAAMHLAAARKAGATILGVWDPNRRLAAGFAEHEACAVIDEFDVLVANRPELIVVLGTPLQMPDRLRAVVAAGIPAIVEKPIAPDAARLRPLADDIGARGAWVAVALPQRLSPLHRALAELRAAGRAGPVSHAQFRIINGPPGRYHADDVAWVLDPEVGGGGALRNLGIHGVDSFLAMVGEQGVRVESVAFGRPVHRARVEDYALLTLRASDGALGHVEAGYTFASTAPGGDFEWRVSARNAYLLDRDGAPRVTTLDDGKTHSLAATRTSGRYDEFMAETLRRLAAGERPQASVADCLRAMELIDEAYRMRSRGAQIDRARPV